MGILSHAATANGVATCSVTLQQPMVLQRHAVTANGVAVWLFL